MKILQGTQTQMAFKILPLYSSDKKATINEQEAKTNKHTTFINKLFIIIIIIIIIIIVIIII